MEGDGSSSSDVEPAGGTPCVRVLPNKMGSVTLGVVQLVRVEVGVDTPVWVGFPLGVNIAVMLTCHLL